MSTGTPDRVWLAVEHDSESSTVRAVFEQRGDADAFAAAYRHSLEVEEHVVHGPGVWPVVVTLWMAYGEVVTRPHAHWPHMANAVELGREGASPCTGSPLELTEKVYLAGEWLPTAADAELTAYETDGCPKLKIGVRGLDRDAVWAKATELYEGKASGVRLSHGSRSDASVSEPPKA